MRIDHRYMAKMLIVMLSTNTTTREIETNARNIKKIYKNIFFFIFTGFEAAPPGYSSLLNALDWLT